MATRKEMLAKEIAKAVGAGRVVALPTVDFGDPNRPRTCLEVDFPILPVNQVAVIEGNAGKPIYQMSKWWARRRSSVFRAMLIAAATRAPEDPSHAARLVWDHYYANHQKKGAFGHLKVADIFMGGGTTLVEGSRLGMQMVGNDLNPVAWFVCKQELAQVDLEEVKRLLADIETEVKPRIMPYYCCDGPNGEKGTWTHRPTGRKMGGDFDPLAIPWDERKDYAYEGPEIIYTFWAKHGPCQVTGCGHRTPIMSSPLMAIKTLSVKYWERTCRSCGTFFHCEEKEVRMAPGVPLCVAPTESPFSTLDPRRGVRCPACGTCELADLDKGKTKKVDLSLLVHPQWMAGCPSQDPEGRPYGGSAQDDAESTVRWNQARAGSIRLLEVRGTLPDEVTCPETGVTFRTGKEGGTVPKKSTFACQADGRANDVLTAIKATGKTGPMAGYAIQGHDSRKADRRAYNGRFFAPFGPALARQYDEALKEWEARKDADLSAYWPTSKLPYGFMTHHLQGGVPNHGHTHWWTMFNPRQMLAHTQILRAISQLGRYDDAVREYVLGAFQQYLQAQTMMCWWNITTDRLAVAFSNNNFHPKATAIEGGWPWADYGHSRWASCTRKIFEAQEWSRSPTELVVPGNLRGPHLEVVRANFSGKSEKVNIPDEVGPCRLGIGSSTDLTVIDSMTIDLVITDPPFGGLLHYSELSDFFYVWLRLVLKDRYPDLFTDEYTPKALEAVANRAREPEDPDGFYQKILTQCWREAHRILKPGGLLAFTFHHSEDEPWVAVLESLFEAGFYLEATYPIRSDETKGEGEFGSKTIEYDIIHVCRKRSEEPTPVSWGRMRREVLADVRQLRGLLENHAKEGLPAADLQVIRRGKALEYFSRHYGKVYVDEGRTMNVKEALAGINQLIDEDGRPASEPPPLIAEPITRQFLRIFEGNTDVPRDQMQKFLRGSGLAPDEFVQRGWCTEKNKVFTLVSPLDFARSWHGRHKNKLSCDLDQALVAIGACFEGSAISLTDTLRNGSFRPHVALMPLLQWFQKTSPQKLIRTAATTAITICKNENLFARRTTEVLHLFGEEAP